MTTLFNISNKKTAEANSNYFEAYLIYDWLTIVALQSAAYLEDSPLQQHLSSFKTTLHILISIIRSSEGS